MKTFKDLLVWQHATTFATHIYLITKCFPKDEIYGITSQMRRASVSIASNLAEGSKRGSKKEFAYFIRVAQGSGAEIETQLIISKNLKYINEKDFINLAKELESIMKMLTNLFKTMV